ncbi:MAG: hypothetical protein AAFN78_07125, partial [Pseudomonadota bacterium]
MNRVLLALLCALCLAGCAASRPAPDDSVPVEYLLTLDKTMDHMQEMPRANTVVVARKPVCRREPRVDSRMTRIVCKGELDKAHLKRADMAGLRAFRRN